MSLAVILIALGLFASPVREAPALLAGLEIISGNDQIEITEPAAEPILPLVTKQSLVTSGQGENEWCG